MKREILFWEKQGFRQIWLMLILLGINVLIWFGIVHQIFLEHPLGDKPMSDAGLIVAAVLAGLFTLWFLTFKLETVIKEDGIYARFRPFSRKFRYYPWAVMKECYVRQYQPIREYGGWGVRGLSVKNSAWNVSGNMGIQIITTNGSRMLIGTSKPDAAIAILQQLGRLTPGPSTA